MPYNAPSESKKSSVVVTKKMLASGLDLHIIVQVAGVSVEELKNLK